MPNSEYIDPRTAADRLSKMDEMRSYVETLCPSELASLASKWQEPDIYFLIWEVAYEQAAAAFAMNESELSEDYRIISEFLSFQDALKNDPSFHPVTVQSFDRYYELIAEYRD